MNLYFLCCHQFVFKMLCITLSILEIVISLLCPMFDSLFPHSCLCVCPPGRQSLRQGLTLFERDPRKQKSAGGEVSQGRGRGNRSTSSEEPGTTHFRVVLWKDGQSGEVTCQIPPRANQGFLLDRLHRGISGLLFMYTNRAPRVLEKAIGGGEKGCRGPRGKALRSCCRAGGGRCAGH